MKAKTQIPLCQVDNSIKTLVANTRHKLNYSTECLWWDAFDYYHEDELTKPELVQASFVFYLKSGGTYIPLIVVDFCLDVVTNKVNPWEDT